MWITEHQVLVNWDKQLRVQWDDVLKSGSRISNGKRCVYVIHFLFNPPSISLLVTAHGSDVSVCRHFFFFATFDSHMHALKLLSRFPLRFVAFCSHFARIYTQLSPPSAKPEKHSERFLLCKWKMCSKNRWMETRWLMSRWRTLLIQMENLQLHKKQLDHIKHQTNRKVRTIP